MALRDRLRQLSSPEGEGKSLHATEAEAQSLAERLPDLLIEAMRISSTIVHGIHGRRRPGPGETFWQFRPYENTDPAAMIDWRRSASSDHLYVREREWEAAHTFWLWADLSPSMDFRSDLAQQSKRDRALILLFATAELLVRSGERVGVLGLTAPTASRRATTRLAEAIGANLSSAAHQAGLPPPERLSRFAGVILFGDFLDPSEDVNQRMTEIAGSGVTGHLIQILDPAEETLPYEGRAEFLGPEGAERWLADRVESLRERYIEKLAAHKQAIQLQARTLGWSHVVHHTDRSAAEPLLQLIMRLQSTDAGAAAPYAAPSMGGAA